LKEKKKELLKKLKFNEENYEEEIEKYKESGLAYDPDYDEEMPNLLGINEAFKRNPLMDELIAVCEQIELYNDEVFFPLKKKKN
jgi:hypothetical protein